MYNGFDFLMLSRFSNGRVVTVAKGVVSQVAGSGATFLISYFSLVYDSTEKYGLFNILFSAVLFCGMVTNALWANQLVVGWAGIEVSSRQFAVRFFLKKIVLFCALSGVAVCGITIFFGGVLFVGMEPGFGFGFGLFCAVSSLLFSVREFYVRLLYARKYESGVLLANVTSFFFSAAFVVPIIVNYSVDSFGLKLLLSYLFLSCGSALYFYQKSARRAGETVSSEPGNVVCQQALKGGGWSLLSAVFFFARNQSHVLLGSMFGGASLVGMLSAARMFVAPILMFMPTVGQMLLPRLSANAADSLRLTRNRCLKIGFVILFLCLTYFGIVFILLEASWLKSKVSADKIVYVYPWFAFSVALCFSSIFQFGMQSKKIFRQLASFNIFATVLGLSSVFLMPGYDPGGRILISMSVGEVVLAILIFNKMSGGR